MDLDGEVAAIKRRTERLEQEVFGRRQQASSRPNAAIAEHHLENGDLGEAGRVLGLERSHDGKETDESYERRLRAAVYGAEKADAVQPQKLEVGDDPKPVVGAGTDSDE